MPSSPGRSLSQLQAEVEAEEDMRNASDSDEDLAALDDLKPLSWKTSAVKGKGKEEDKQGEKQEKETEVLWLDSSDSDDQMESVEAQRVIERSIKASASPSTAVKPEPSTSKATLSSGKKSHPFNFSDSDSDLELPDIDPSSKRKTSSHSRPTSSQGASTSPSKKRRVTSPTPPIASSSTSNRPVPPSTASSSAAASLVALRSSITSLLTAYTMRRIVRPEFVRKKIELREDAKELGIDFDAEFGEQFEDVEAEQDRSKALTKKGKDTKGKGKAKDVKPRLGGGGIVIDTRLTSAQVRAAAAKGGQGSNTSPPKGGYKPFAPKPNAQIIARKKAEWEKAKIVTSGKAAAALKENEEALERAKKKMVWKEEKRLKEMRRKGLQGGARGGVDGWIAGAAAGPSKGAMPGGFGAGAGPDMESDSGKDSEDEAGSSAPEDDRWNLGTAMGLAKFRQRLPSMLGGRSEANNDLAAFHRRNRNDHLKSHEAVTNALKELNLPDQNAIIPGMRTHLLPFQFISVAWMANRELQKPCGGILADEMGLGKTVQTIALMMARRSTDAEIKTNLIVVPLSLLSQWEDEIDKFAIGQSVHIYHGSNKYKAKTTEELMQFDVVLTTHSTVSLEWPKKKKKKNPDDDSEDENGKKPKEPGLLYQMCFYRIIIDEAHIARNPRSRIAQAIHKLDGVFRWALTGTPMINSLRDYYPLHRFLRNRPWSDRDTYHGRITKQEKQNPVEAGRIADEALAGLVMRRRKSDKLGEEVLVKLESKTEKLIKLEFDAVEREIYDDIERGFQAKINKFFQQGTLFKNFHFILVLILRLKQLTVHPHLLAERLGEYSREDELERAKKILGETAVKRIQAERLSIAVKRRELDEDDEEDVCGDEGTCPVCRDPIIAIVGEGVVTACAHALCRICADELLQQPSPEQNDDFVTGQRKCKKDERPCPLCRAPFSETLIVEYECFEPDSEALDAAYDDAFIDDGDEEEEDKKFFLKSEEGKGKAKAAIPRFIEIESDEDDDLVDPSQFFDIKPKIKTDPGDVKPKIESGGSLGRVKKEEGKDIKPRIGSPSVRASSSSSSKGTPTIKRTPSSDRKPVPDDDEKKPATMSPFVPSAKMIYILKKLQAFKAEDDRQIADIESGKLVLPPDAPPPETKTIVLSQWTSSLDLLDRYLTENGIEVARFQGSSSADERRDAIRMLDRSPEIRVLLLSTKAGGVGLNLTSACRVLSMDLAWSRAVEAQAFDRTYRLGQRRPVEIERIIINDTIEERILNLQERKTLLSDISLAEGQGDPNFNPANISIPEILSLFRLDMNGQREGENGPGGGGGGGGGRGGRGGGSRGGTPRRGGFRGGGGFFRGGGRRDDY